MSDAKNFNAKNGLSINGTQVIDSRANGTFNVLTANSIILPSGNIVATTSAAFNAANSGITLAQAAFNQGNSTATYANTGITLAQAAFNQGNSTATYANTKFSSSGGTISGDVNVTGQTNISNTTQSTSNTTGALTVSGGLGIQGNVWAGAVFSNTVNLLNYTQAAFDKANTGGGGGGTTSSEITTTIPGITTSPYISTSRRYFLESKSFTYVGASVSQLPTNNIVININKNGTFQANLTINSSSYYTNYQPISINCNSGDYITIDLVSGTSTDLMVYFK